MRLAKFDIRHVGDVARNLLGDVSISDASKARVEARVPPRHAAASGWPLGASGRVVGA